MWRKLSTYRQAIALMIIWTALVSVLITILRRKQQEETSLLVAQRGAGDSVQVKRKPSSKLKKIPITPETARSASAAKTDDGKMQEPGSSDDLTAITGIGPKTTAALNAAGIQTFKKIAKLDAETLSNLLKNQGARATKPETWIEQAELAAKEGLEALKKFQDAQKN
jgi:predicted flap endonuclease-1-like 5' DNA nuclease